MTIRIATVCEPVGASQVTLVTGDGFGPAGPEAERSDHAAKTLLDPSAVRPPFLQPNGRDAPIGEPTFRSDRGLAEPIL